VTLDELLEEHEIWLVRLLGHTPNLRRWAAQAAQDFGLGLDFELAALYHDYGRLFVPGRPYLRPRPLTQQLQTQGEEAQSLVEEARNTLSDLQKSFEELKSQNEAQWAEFRSTLVKAQEDLHTAQRNLRTELGLQVNELRGDVERRLEQFSQRQQKALEEVEHKTKEVVEGVDQLLQEQKRELENQWKKLVQLASSQNTLVGKVKLANNVAIAAFVAATVAVILAFVLGR
jgi:ElaB/YqjD/DUF883 family membrane-anchored ribosome-binding protein